MKTKASAFLKQVVSLVMSMVKAKSVALKSKASAVKTRLIIFGLLRNKKVLMSAISHKIQALMGQDHQDKRRRPTTAAAGVDDVDNSKAIVPYSAVAAPSSDHDQVPDHPDDDHVAASAGGEMVAEYYFPGGGGGGSEAGADVEEEEEEEEDDGYPDLRHSLFDEEDDDRYLRGLGDVDGTGSVIDLVKNSRGEGRGEFVLEDEIDHVADVFIRRFHRQMRMQKLDSFKRYQEMLEMSA